MSGAAVELRDLTLSYGTRRAVDGVSARVGAAEIVALLGPNGAGKSTLLRAVSGNDSGNGRASGAGLAQRVGQVLIDDVPLDEYDGASLARIVAVVPGQSRVAFPLRVEELVALGRIPHEHPLLGPRAGDRVARDRRGHRPARIAERVRRGRDDTADQLVGSHLHADGHRPTRHDLAVDVTGLDVEARFRRLSRRGGHGEHDRPDRRRDDSCHSTCEPHTTTDAAPRQCVPPTSGPLRGRATATSMPGGPAAGMSVRCRGRVGVVSKACRDRRRVGTAVSPRGGRAGCT